MTHPFYPSTATLKPRKARCIAECLTLEQLPNIGPSLANDLRRLGLKLPHQLQGQDAWFMYQDLCQLTHVLQDPCVLDTFMAICDFAAGAAPQAWWFYTATRKAQYTLALQALRLSLQSPDAPATATTATTPTPPQSAPNHSNSSDSYRTLHSRTTHFMHSQ